MIWTTRDGTKIDIRDMTDTHLSNAINMLDRRIETLQDELSACFGFPSDSMASYYAEGEVNGVTTEIGAVAEMKWQLQQEQRRRKRC